MSNFEDLSDEIIISIFEYLTLEEFSSIFGQLNNRLACIVFDHPWTQHRLNIQMIAKDDALDEKIKFINDMKLTSRISAIHIRPHCSYQSINEFNKRNPLENFDKLRALSLNHVTLEEGESIFSPECLSKLKHLARICLIFSLKIEQNEYCLRLERLIAQILIHPSLRHVILQTARSLDFSQLQLPSPVEYLDIDYCSFQSLYTLFQFTPSLRHLTATIAIYGESNTQQTPIFPVLNSLKLNLSIPAFDHLLSFLEKFPKLQKLHIVTYSVIEPLTFTSSWIKLITEHLPVLYKFKRESNVPLENIEEYIKLFHWLNGWRSIDKSVPNGSNYSRMTVINIRY
ncbi:unnamed protein product [Adineta steineri]|uniref:F-box domain-containing protein n=1 Tax=Adineta steineri TaxID=433720 RepID=A0A818PVI5_9BILA|nr:unnamed protein product [Adineta steineri]